MQVAAKIQAFPWVRFSKYLAVVMLTALVFVVPIFWVDKYTVIWLMLGFAVSMLIFEQLTTPKIILPSEALPPVIRAELIAKWRGDRWEGIIGRVFGLTLIFMFLAPTGDDLYATFDWKSVGAIAIFVALGAWLLVEKVYK